MPYYKQEDLEAMNFKKLGKNVKISQLASIYNFDQIELGDNCRIDDFCLLSGKISIGSFCHITPMCLIAGGSPGVTLENYVTLAYGVKIFSQSDDYKGNSLTNSLIPKKFKAEIFKPVLVERLSIIGANSTILPGVTIHEGCSVGAMSLVTKDLDSWGIYYGVPAKRKEERSKNMLRLIADFEKELANDPL